MCLPYSNIARPSQAKRSHPLRYGPLDSCSLTVFLFKFLGLLTLTVLLQRLVKLFGLDIDCSSPSLGARALREVGTHAAIRPRKRHMDKIITAPVYHRFPARAFTTCRAYYFFSIPLNPNLRHIKTIPLYFLPTTITLRRTDQINVILTPTLHQVTGFNVSGINQMFVW